MGTAHSCTHVTEQLHLPVALYKQRGVGGFRNRREKRRVFREERQSQREGRKQKGVFSSLKDGFAQDDGAMAGSRLRRAELVGALSR